MSPELKSALSQDIAHLASALIFILVGAIVTGIIFRRKKRSFLTGAWIGAVATGVLTIWLDLTIYPVIALWAGLVIFLPRADSQLKRSVQPPDQAPSGSFLAGINQHPGTPNKHSIFISYRREDSAEVVGRIYDRLVQRFGAEAVFKDIESIPYGVDFRNYLMDVVGECGALIAVIGDKWLTILGESGIRRIDEPSDFVRIEIASALQRNVPVVPLLIKGARMPKETDLPDALKNMAHRHSIEVRNDPDFHADIDRLIKSLEQQLGMSASVSRSRDAKSI